MQITNNTFHAVEHDHCQTCDRADFLNTAEQCENCALNTYCGTDGCPNIAHVDSEDWVDGERRCSQCELAQAVVNGEGIEYWIPRVAADKTLHVIDPIFGAIPQSVWDAAGRA